MSKLVVVFLAMLAVVSAWGPREIIYSRTVVPPSWTLVTKAEPQEMMTVTFALKQQNLDKLEKMYWSVSDPDSKEYGNFMSMEEISKLVSPPRRVMLTLRQFLMEYGVAAVNIMSRGDSLTMRAPVSVVEPLFNTDLRYFIHEKGNVIIRHFGDYSLPRDILSLIDMVTGISDFPMSRPSSRKVTKASFTDANVVPQTLNAIYNVPAGTKITNPASSVSVAEFQNDASFLWSDMATFYKETGITTNNVSHIVGPFSTSADTEATLDIQYATAVGVGATNWYWTETNWMYDFANNFFNTKEVPLIVSMSWGWSEVAQCTIDNDCSTLGINAQTYVTRVNTEFQKIGLRGVSLISASGDSGANGRTDPLCTDSKLHPVFPGASPYVTSVGATQLDNPKTDLKNPPAVCKMSPPCASGGEEVAVSVSVAGFASGGGFSVYASQPAFQTEFVAKYLNSSKTLPPSSYFNAQGRAYPDVAADGHNFLIFMDGAWTTVGGTSAAAPTFAGIVAILNDAKITKTGKPLGPLNPFLYKMAKALPTAFNDITKGDNICTEYGCASSCKGFTAEAGWDPVTGLGSPNVAEMLKYVKTL